MICNLVATVVFLSVSAFAESASWILTTPSYKYVKVNGVGLKASPFWDLPQLRQVQTTNAEALVFLPESIYLKVFKNSHIHWDGSVLQVVEGKVYIKVVSSDVFIQVPTLFKFIMNPGDFVIEHDPKSKAVSFEVLSRAQPIQIDSDDRVMTTAEGTKLSFQAEIVEGEMAYDFLLNDRKIPKLKMKKNQVKKPIILDTTIWTSGVRKAVSAKTQQIKKEALEGSKYICKSPSGVLQACHFVQEGTACARYSCNLSGQWAQKTIFSSNDLCPKAKTVKDCEWLGR